ncbi:MAG TPA: PIN domain-containing protein [Thermoanaerobaculia bacterium]
MSGRIALDSNVIIALLRTRANIEPHPFALDVAIPLTVLGELYAGAYMSANKESNLQLLSEFLAGRFILAPDQDTARRYGVLRAHLRGTAPNVAKVNDLWIAALCLQHNLPLLTNDRGFDSIAELTVIHW